MVQLLTIGKFKSGLVLCLALSTSAHAIILFGAGNSENITNPGNGLPFDTVARVASADGVEDGGSGVHLGGGYIITAAHILNTELNSVTFDSSTFYARDLSFSPVQIGNTDLKIFRLSSIPTVGAATLYNGSSELLHSASLVGFGSGRRNGEALNSLVVEFAPGGSPLVKRWGTNDPVTTVPAFSYTQTGITYTFDAIQTSLGASGAANPGTGDFEAAAGPRDSGSGLFQFIDGNWYLTGLTSAIFAQNPGSATFGEDLPGIFAGGSASIPVGAGDPNLFVQISSYAADIATIIPEPSTLFLSLTSGLFLLRRRR